jgi:hypothetical protein
MMGALSLLTSISSSLVVSRIGLSFFLVGRSDGFGVAATWEEGGRSTRGLDRHGIYTTWLLDGGGVRLVGIRDIGPQNQL